MDTQKMIDALNKAVALEHTAVMQYKQHALLVSGLWRKEYEGFFSGQSESAHGHAHKFGQKVVILGGIPTVELGAPIRQSTDLEEMLNQDLELERTALQAYMDAHALTDDNLPLRIMLENQIEAEQEDIEELEMYLGMVQTSGLEREVNLRRVG